MSKVTVVGAGARICGCAASTQITDTEPDQGMG